MASENEKESKSLIETTAASFGRDLKEAQSLGHVDKADADVEGLFDLGKRTEDSPAYQAVWGKTFPVQNFDVGLLSSNTGALDKVFKESIAVISRHKKAGTLYAADGKIPEQVLTDLSAAGYWGVLIDQKYGGAGASFSAFSRFITDVAQVEPTIAGLASVHGCIGAVDPVNHFGNEEQKAKYLPLLASGKRLSAFALTEPGAGSDLTAIKTEAVLSGDKYLVSGRKLFITNAGLGRTVGLVCMIEGKQSVLIVDLPDKEDQTFKIHRYGISALSHANNVGLEFNNFPVPKENLLVGKGLMIAYHGLNKGRVALCANAAGVMRYLLANCIPWAKFRITYTKQIGERELVQRRLGEMAGLIVGCDSLVRWCAWLLDQGFRGEMECIIAKRFGSESLKEAAIEYFMKTHGGRSFLHGHIFGDNIHDFLAPCIYEGEGEMLSMAFLKALIKEHGEQYFLPIAERVGALKANGTFKEFNQANPYHVWLLRKEMFNYGMWFIGKNLEMRSAVDCSWMPKELRPSAIFAINSLRKMPLKISNIMTRHQAKLIDRQCRMALISQNIQDYLTIVATCSYASRSDDPLIIAAAEVQCEKMKMKLTGSSPSDAYFRKVTKLGKRILDGEFKELAAAEVEEIKMSY
jgi:alkylation response protein AidB-like acyl-CoA dehydrogenase